MFSIAGNESPLSINPSSLTAWKGSCVLIPCQISEVCNLGKVNRLAVAWYFEPLEDNVPRENNGHLLYDSSKTSEDLITSTSPDFRGLVRFVGNLSNRDCSLIVSQLQMNESGSYTAYIVDSNDNWRLKWHLNATVKIAGKSFAEQLVFLFFPCKSRASAETEKLSKYYLQDLDQ
uniref:B-cell receptor CD22 first Ig-like domain-containing protein n=1 Tax=Varanus komodoensis TaxID=61221 RepID=A0A8D2IML1_VARKO